MTPPETTDLELLYPFYLDTDMTMAFAAAITGGVAMQSEDVGDVKTQDEKTRELRAGIRLFDVLDLGGHGKRARRESVKSRSRMIRHHTEASIFITLYQELLRRGSIVDLTLEHLHTGEIISIEEGPATAPLLRVVDQVLRLLELTGPEDKPESVPNPPKPTPNRQKQKPGRVQPPLQPKAPDPPKAPDEEVNPAVVALKRLFRSLRADLEFSGMTDIAVRRETGVSILLTLDNRFVTDQALELLHTSRFRVVGKVTQIWKTENDFVNLYRRSVLSLVPALPVAMGWLVLQMLGEMAKVIDVAELQRSASAAVGIEANQVATTSEIKIGDDFQAMFPGMTGPVIQILPLAVCA